MTVLVLLVAACGNAKSGSSAASTTAAPGGSSASTPGSGSAGTNQDLPVDAPGVTSAEIKVGGVASVTNPLGGSYADAFAGTQAYFDMVNSEGGLYGRKLVLGAKEDDQAVNNSTEVTALLDQEHVFAVLPVATLLFTGAQQLVNQNIPTFGWDINQEWSGTTADPRLNMFGEAGSYLSFTGADPTLPWIATQAHAHKLGILAYAVPQSKACSQGVKNSFAKFGKQADAKVVYEDESLAFGTTDLSVQVAAMKKAGVDLVSTCMDTNGVVTLAKAMKQQGLKAPQYMPDSYDHAFLKNYSDLFQGSFVRSDFVQFEVPDKPKGLQQYLTWIAKQKVNPSENSLNGWLNAALFVAGLKAAGPNFSRQKLIDAINQMTAWTADGLITATNWKTAHTQGVSDEGHCQFTSIIKGDSFDPVYSKPGKPFVCPVVKADSLGTRYTATT